jgi:hypothetical protein
VASEASSRVEFGSMPIQAQIHVPGGKDTVLSGKACYRCVCSIEALPAPHAESKAEKQRRRVKWRVRYFVVQRHRALVLLLRPLLLRLQQQRKLEKAAGGCKEVACHMSPGRSTARRVLRGLSPKISRRGGLLFRRSTARQFCSSPLACYARDTRDRQPTTSFATRSISIPSKIRPSEGRNSLRLRRSSLETS